MLLFDGNCGICNVVINRLLKKGLLSKNEIFAVKSARDLANFNNLYKLNIYNFEEMILIKNSTVFKGYFAFKEIFLSSKSVLRFPFLLPLNNCLGPIIYSLFARNRHRFAKNSSCGLE